MQDSLGAVFVLASSVPNSEIYRYIVLFELTHMTIGNSWYPVIWKFLIRKRREKASLADVRITNNHYLHLYY